MAETLLTQDTLYRDDFYAWARREAEVLRGMAAQGTASEPDLANLAEEVDGLAQGLKSAVRRQVRCILEHLLTLEHSPARELRYQWRRSIIKARAQLDDDLTRSLETELRAELDVQCRKARRLAASRLAEHGEADTARALPTSCPYSFDQVVAEDWFPANRSGLVDPGPIG